MKKISLLFCGLLAFAGSGFSQNLPSYVPANGLVGWWPFNGNANDESGNNNNGTVNGATLTADRFGNVGKAYGFDGQANKISLSSLTSDSITSMSISGWFKATAGASIFAISNGCNGADGLRLFIGLDNNLYWGVEKSSCLGYGIFSNQINYNDNNWHFFYASYVKNNPTYTSSDFRLFVDGADVGIANPPSTSGIVSPVANSSFSNTLGNHNLNSDGFTGSLDDIAIYNRALTQQEITALYQGANTTTNCPTFPASLTQGLVGYWPFCGNANDESSNNLTNNSGVLQYSTDRFGNQGSSLRFLNDTNSFLTSNIPYSPNVTIGFWLKQNQPVTNFPVPFYFHNGDYSGNGYTFYSNSSHFSSNFSLFGVRLGTNSGTPPSNWFDSSVPYSGADSSWNQFIITIDNQENKILIYKNSVLSSSQSFQGQILNYSKVNFGHARKGNRQERYVGSLDDIAIWNRVLSQEEITQLYQVTTSNLEFAFSKTSQIQLRPNPSNGNVTLDAGNLSSMQGWKYKVANTLGQTVVNETAISQQQTMIDLSNWGGNGIYYLHLINPQGHAIEIKKIVLAP